VSRPRLLPKGVSAFLDRHGKERLRYRRKGQPTHYFQAQFGTEEFRTEYRACLDGVPNARPIGAEQIVPGTISDLIVRYYRSSGWQQKSDGAKHHDRLIIEKFRAKHGDKRVRAIGYEHVDAIIGAKASATPFAAQKLRKILRRLLGYAAKIGMAERNVALDSEPVKAKSSGYHTWTEDEIDRYQKHHAYGTNARLALELMLWTGQRRSDAIRMGLQHVQDGRISVQQQKTATRLLIPVSEQLRTAITAMPPHKHLTFLITEQGRPFTAAGFGNWFRDRCDEAGLPGCTAHGLRKAMARRLAQLGMSNQSLKSVGGWRGDSEVALYTRDADQMALADKAIAELSRWDLANRAEGLANER
jgi:integrase